MMSSVLVIFCSCLCAARICDEVFLPVALFHLVAMEFAAFPRDGGP